MPVSVLTIDTPSEHFPGLIAASGFTRNSGFGQRLNAKG